jgi:hypothetical protein
MADCRERDKIEDYRKLPFIGRNRMLLPMSKSKKALRTNMLKTLRITSVLAVVLAAVFLVLPAVFGVRRDERAEQFLSAPGATEQFNKAKGQKTAGGEGQISPLVKEAEAFALYLNPPKPKTPPRQAARERGVSAPRPPVVSAKFNLIGTSYYALRPELSLALIDEPGKGFRWVRQSGDVGHLVIEQVKDGVVLVRDGQRTYELEVERPKKRSLLKGSASDGRITRTHGSPARTEDKAVARITSTEDSPISPEEEALLARLVDEEGLPLIPPPPPRRGEIAGTEDSHDDLQAVRSSRDDARVDKIFAELESMRVGDQEARRLARLGQKLQHVQQDPNRPPNEEVDDGADEETQSEPNKAV